MVGPLTMPSSSGDTIFTRMSCAAAVWPSAAAGAMNSDSPKCEVRRARLTSDFETSDLTSDHFCLPSGPLRRAFGRERAVRGQRGDVVIQPIVGDRLRRADEREPVGSGAAGRTCSM